MVKAVQANEVHRADTENAYEAVVKRALADMGKIRLLLGIRGGQQDER